MKLPNQKRILREDVKDAPAWVNGIIDPLNNFMQTVYQAMNKNIDENNTASQIREIVYETPATYPTMDPVSFPSSLKTKAIGCYLLQIYDRETYLPVAGPCYVPWIEDNGVIKIYPIPGLAASKTYVVRVRVI